MWLSLQRWFTSSAALEKALPYQGFFWAFGLFIVSCEVTHFLDIVTVWQLVCWLAASAKILTAVSTVGTAIVLTVAAQPKDCRK